MDQRAPRDDTRLLSDFGVPAESESLWQALLDRPDADIEELSGVTGLSPDGVRDNAQRLIEQQLARPGSTRSGWVLIDPALAIEAHVIRSERRLAEAAESLAAVRAEIPELANKYARGRAVSGEFPAFEIVVPLEEIRRQLYIAADGEREEFRSMCQFATPSAQYDSQEIDFLTLARGVKTRSIVAQSHLADPELFAGFQECARRGEEYRSMPEVPIDVRIFDRDLAVLPVSATDRSLGAMFIRVPHLVDVFIYTFDHLWEEAAPVFVEQTDNGFPAGRAGRILELLAVGSTDESIGRSLGVGARTVRREVSELKSLLGVSSRAEIAAAAVRRGWL